jgi:hypothetical protein
MQKSVDLGKGLVLRTVRNGEDARKFAIFNGEMNNAREGATCACVLGHHPFLAYSDYRIVEDTRSGQIVSTTCTLPWEIQFETSRLQAAMLEMVLTHPDYRRQGLVRRQIEVFHQDAVERHADFTMIWGIPYYYRQFGYSYCLEGETAEVLPVFQAPDLNPDRAPEIRLRSAELSDIPVLEGFYNRSMQSLDIWIPRPAEYWQYLIQWAKFPIQVIEDNQAGVVHGYAVNVQSPQKCLVLESSIDNQQIALTYLAMLKTHKVSVLSVAWPEKGTLAQAARSLGSHALPGGQWLLRLPDAGNFLLSIKPLLEERLARSGLHSLCLDLVVNLYHNTWQIRIRQGKLAEIRRLGFVNVAMGSDGGDLCIPQDAFTRLVFGFRSLDELQDAWPDILVKPEIRWLVEVLFPRLSTHLFTPYHYWGPPDGISIAG